MVSLQTSTGIMVIMSYVKLNGDSPIGQLVWALLREGCMMTLFKLWTTLGISWSWSKTIYPLKA